MKAVLVKESTNSLYIGEVEEPAFGANDILVNIKATAVNRADLVQKIGKYPPPAGESNVLGLEMAGVIEKIGDSVTGWAIGDVVCALLAGGGYAEKARVPSGVAMPVPRGFSFEEAAAIPEVFLTAYLNIFMLGGFQTKQTVLIHAAAGGVGPAAIQLVKQSGGIVIATVRSEEKVAACREIGADLVINTQTEDFSSVTNEFTQGKGVSVILDSVGASYYEGNQACLALDGRLIIIGLMGGYIVPTLDLRKLMLKRWQIIGSTLRSLSVERKTEVVSNFSKCFLPMFSDGRLKPILDSVWDVGMFNQAHERMEKNLNVGKIIVRTNFGE